LSKNNPHVLIKFVAVIKKSLDICRRPIHIDLPKKIEKKLVLKAHLHYNFYKGN